METKRRIRLGLCLAIGLGWAIPALGVGVEWRIVGDGSSVLVAPDACKRSAPGSGGCGGANPETPLRGRLHADAGDARFSELRGILDLEGQGKLVVTGGEIKFADGGRGWVGQLITSTHGSFALRTPAAGTVGAALGMAEASNWLLLFAESLPESGSEFGRLGLVLQARVVPTAKLRRSVSEAPLSLLLAVACAFPIGRRLTRESDRA